MAIVFCPRCQTARNMAESLTRWEAIDEDDNKTAMITRSYTCEMCNTFVRSEDEKLTPIEEGEAPQLGAQDVDESEEGDQKKRVGF
jgi:hypothetical protein